MKFTISYDVLERLIRAAAPRLRKADALTISAAHSSVFIALGGEGAGSDVPVDRVGAVTVSAKPFVEIIKTYKGAEALNFDGGPEGLRIQTFTMPILN